MGKRLEIKSILYVEDEQAIQTELAEVLQDFCTTLYIADQGKQGLALYQQYHPDIVITDIKMPIMDGITMAKAIKAQDENAHVIFLTALSDSESMQEAISLQADYYVFKPVDLEILEQVLGKSIKRIFLQQEHERITRSELERKAELEAILTTIREGIVIVDLDAHILYANPAYLDMVGYEAQDIKNKCFWELVVPTDRDKLKVAFSQILHQGMMSDLQIFCFNIERTVFVMNLDAVLMSDQQRILLSVRDITEVQYAQQLLAEYVELIDENIVVSKTDLDGFITHISTAFSRLCGYSTDELIGHTHRLLRHPDMSAAYYRHLWQCLERDQVWQGEFKNLNKQKEAYWVQTKIYPNYDLFGNKIAYTSISRDITLQKQLEKLSITDPLTACYNRRYFNTVFSKFIQAAKRNNERVCFAILDIDFFKNYNDTYGHQQGDTVLQQVTETLGELLNRADDYLFRLGGEEFGVLFKSVSYEAAQRFADTLLKQIANLKIPHKTSQVLPYVTVSMGLICRYALAIDNNERLYKEADDLLYRAKALGRNQVVMSVE